VFLAAAAVEAAPDDPAPLLKDWCLQLVDQLDLSDAALSRYLDERSRTDALNHALQARADRAWRPLERADVADVTRHAWKAYEAGTSRALLLGKNPHAFSIAFSEWATLLGYADKSTARKVVYHAQDDAQLLIILDKGDMKKGGLPSLICFRGQNETLAEAAIDGLSSPEYLRRQKVDNSVPVGVDGDEDSVSTPPLEPTGDDLTPLPSRNGKGTYVHADDGPNLTTEEITLFAQAVEIAKRGSGHLTLMRFTTNWRVMFGTPNYEGDIDEAHPGTTLAEALTKAIQAEERAGYCV
jgi:hypothetical protein